MDFQGLEITDEQLRIAIGKAADFYEDNAILVRKEDPYASHVTEEQKDQILDKRLASVAKLRSGVVDNLTHAQRVYYELTGESPSLL